MDRTKQLLQDAIKEAGGQTKFAEALGISQQGVSYLVTKAKNVSAEIAVAIDKATNGKIKKSDLRPDIFGDAA